MLEVNAAAFTTCVKLLSDLAGVAPGDEATGSAVEATLDLLSTHCRILGLTISPIEIMGVRSALEGSLTEEQARSEFRHLFFTFLRELLACQFIYIETPKRKEMYAKSPVEFWSRHVWDRFPDCRYDMSEAMKCIALERYTACVYHLFQVVEASLREFGRVMDVSQTKRRTNSGLKIHDHDWGSMAAAIDTKLKNTSPRTVRAKRLIAERKLALGRFENVRDARNQVSHPDEREFTESEAWDFMTQIPPFMRQLVRAIPTTRKLV